MHVFSFCNLSVQYLDVLCLITGSANQNGTAASRELHSLFMPSRSRAVTSRPGPYTTSRVNRRARTATETTWTPTFFCFSKKDAVTTVKSPAEKVRLSSYGLGHKKVQLLSQDSEQTVYEKLCEAYPLLKDCGGFELLKCTKCRNKLELLTGGWSVQNLKALGSQGVIYIRPIQRDIPLSNDTVTQRVEITEKCLLCHQNFPITELRGHYQMCELQLVSFFFL